MQLVLIYLFLIGATHSTEFFYSESAGIARYLSEDEVWRKDGKVYYQEVLYTGTLYSCYPDGKLKRERSYVKGKREGDTQLWYPDGQLAAIQPYRDNRKEGLHLSWWANGCLKSEKQFEHGAYHGRVACWYEEGQVYQLLNYVHGKEAGHQQSWTQSGDRFANYVVKEGHRYGLIGSKPCYTITETQTP